MVYHRGSHLSHFILVSKGDNSAYNNASDDITYPAHTNNPLSTAFANLHNCRHTNKAHSLIFSHYSNINNNKFASIKRL